MDDTPKLKLPYLLPSRAQKHVTHNEALRRLDVIVQIGAISRSVSVPPPSPAEGDCYVVAASATGSWQGKDFEMAAWQDGSWQFYPAETGWLAYISDEGGLIVWDNGGWQTPATELANSLDMLGVNAVPDTTNRLVVSSPASLFDHDGGDHRLNVNKAATGDTASVLFQTGYSGRAEFGLTGSDDWQVKVSADGTSWNVAIEADHVTGRVTFPNTALREVLLADRTYFVRVDGNDGNLGLADDAAGAFASVQAAVDAVAALDLSVFAVTIQLSAGTYSLPVVLRSYLGSGPVKIVGSPSDPGQVILDVSGDCISGDGITGKYFLEGLKLRGSSRCIYMNQGAVCEFDNIHFDGVGTHIYARAQGIIQAVDNGTYEITATQFVRHADTNLPGASYAAYGNTIVLPGLVTTISGDFVRVRRASAANVGACTFINKASVTGRRYTASENAILITGGPADYLPGDAVGVQSTGGILA